MHHGMPYFHSGGYTVDDKATGLFLQYGQQRCIGFPIFMGTLYGGGQLTGQCTGYFE